MLTVAGGILLAVVLAFLVPWLAILTALVTLAWAVHVLTTAAPRDIATVSAILLGAWGVGEIVVRARPARRSAVQREPDRAADHDTAEHGGPVAM